MYQSYFICCDSCQLLTIRFYTHRKLHHLELMYADRQEVYEEEEKKQLEAQLKELEGLVNEMGEFPEMLLLILHYFPALIMP